MDRERFDGPTEVTLESLGVKTADELLALSADQLSKLLIGATMPPSEKILGAALLRAVDDLRRATDAMAQAASATDAKTANLLKIAKTTLWVSVLAVVVAVAAAVAAA
jgi:hypothetical protein